MPGTVRRRSTSTSLISVALSVLVLTAPTLFAQHSPLGSIYDRNALVIERVHVPTTAHSNRELVLWMLSPVKRPREGSDGDSYTCPEFTLGSYYSGPTRLSLLNTETGQVINTIRLVSPLSDGADEFNIPYRIISGYYYSVPGVRKGREGKPALLKLRDLNGDGTAAETAFFEAEACMGLPTTLTGYSVAQDKVVQYPAEIETTVFEQKIVGDRLGPKKRKGRPKAQNQVWIDYLFSKKPVQPRHWEYEIDYRGRGGCNDAYDLRYDPEREKFVGALTEVCWVDEDKPHAKD